MHRSTGMRLALLGFISSLVVMCATAPKTSTPGEAWINNMHRLSVSYQRLAPYLADTKAFSNPANRVAIEGSMRELVQGAANAVYDPKAPDVDPVIAYTANRFSSEMQQAYGAWRAGDLQWARYSLQRTPNYCIGCHTRGDHGAKDFALSWPTDLNGFSPQMRIEYLMANRQYASAAKEAEALASNVAAAKQDPRGWQLALERVVALDVRVNKDPKAVIELATKVAANAGAPNYIRREAQAWKRSASTWEQQSRSKTSLNSAAKLKQAIHLLQEGSPALDGHVHDALVPNLRASGLLHEVLEDPKSSSYNEALYYSGVAQESIGPIGTSGLGQWYFESCIRAQPHTALSERCYVRLEKAVQDANPLLVYDRSMQSELDLYLTDLRRLSENPAKADEWQKPFRPQMGEEPSR